MGTRADNRDGSCRQVLTGPHKGKWRVQFTNTDKLGRKKRISRLFKSKSEAKGTIQALRQGVALDSKKATKGLSLGEWFDWLSENDWPEVLAERTVHGRMARFNRFVRAIWGSVPLDKIDPMRVRAFYRQLKEDKVGAATILEIKRDMVRVFNQAISPYQRVPMNLANPFKLTVETPQRRDAVALTPEEARKAMKSAKLDKERRAMLAIFLLGGLRLSEQMAVTVDQLLFDRNLIYVDKAVKYGKTGTQTIGLPKGNKCRLVVMCPTLKRILESATAGMAPNRVVWSAMSENKPRMKKLVYATWRTILKDAGLPLSMTPHDCRLTHVNWIEKLMPDVSATTLKEHVGHAAEGVTQVNYTRPLSTAQKILQKNIERVAGQPKAQDARNRGSAQQSRHTTQVAPK